MTNVNTETTAIAPLPKNAVEMIAMKLTQRGANLLECIEHELIRYIGDKRLASLLEATADDESYTGKVRVDNILAAERLKELCKDHPVISKEKTIGIQRAMNTVLRRYGLTGEQRRKALAAPVDTATPIVQPVPVTVVHTAIAA